MNAYAELRKRAVGGDRTALGEVFQVHRLRVSLPPDDDEDLPPIVRAFEQWRAEGGLDKLIQSEEAP